MKKPPYRIPSMRSIRARKKNGLSLVSTFSGCGGGCLGFRWSGYDVLWASEFIESARDTYLANFPGATVSPLDIRDVDPTDVLAEIGRERGDVDVVEGSPPCSAFSMAGKREKHWNEVVPYSETEQRVDDLFFEFARIVDGIRPRAIVAENTSGLVVGKAKGYFKNVLAEFEKLGYRVRAVMLDAQWLGVPQRRKRLFFIGLREDLFDVEPPVPSPLPYRYSVREALDLGGDGLGLLVGRGKQPASIDGPSPTILTHGNLHTFSERGLSIENYAIGAEWDGLRPGESSAKYFNLVKPDPDLPCPTVTQLGGSNPGVASVTHPIQKRKFTIEELRRICGFPDDFVLTGSYPQQWERLGRAVCPPVSKAVGDALAPVLLEGKKR